MKIEKVALAICLAIFTVGGVWTIAEKLTFSNQNHALRIFQQSCIGNTWSGRYIKKQATALYSCDGMDSMFATFFIPAVGKTVQTVLPYLQRGWGDGCFVVGEDWVISLEASNSIYGNNWFDSAIAAKNYASLTGGRVVSFDDIGGRCHAGMF